MQVSSLTFVEEARRQFGKNIRGRRQALGLTQEALAAATETSRTYIAQLEGGIYNATLETICRLAYGLDCTPGALLEGIEWSPETDS